MPRKQGENARDAILRGGSDLFRQQGFVAVTVDQICSAAGVSKGAFFHHFDSKETLAEATLAAWKTATTSQFDKAPFRQIANPREKLSACMQFFIDFFASASTPPSCLAGTIVQEIAQSHDRLRDAADDCFRCGQMQFEALVADAAASQSADIDATSLASLWMATIQGSLLLAKASRDVAVIERNLQQAKAYIESRLDAVPTATKL